MTVNKDKTKVVDFRKPQQPRSQYVFKYGIDVLEIVDKNKYLGTEINEYLNFNVTADDLAGAGGRALGAVISKFCNLRNIAYTTFSKLFQTSVSPILEYASDVWGYKDYIKCEWVQQRAAHYYLGVHSKTPILALNGDMGWSSTNLLRHIKMTKYWNRLINMNDDRLIKRLFLYDKSQCKNNWSSDFKSLCNVAGMSDKSNTMIE